MAIKVTCTNPSCARKFLVKDELKGKKIRCPKCKTILTVGGPPKAAAKKIRFNCQFCHTPLSVAESARGKKLTCPQCGRQTIVPNLSSDLLLDVLPSERKISQHRRLIICPQCGRVLNPGTTRCPDCNFNIVASASAEVTKRGGSGGKSLAFLKFASSDSFLLAGAVLLLLSFFAPLASGVEGGLRGYLVFWKATSGIIPYRVLLFYPVAASVLILALSGSKPPVRGWASILIGALSFILASLIGEAALADILPAEVAGFAGSPAGITGARGIIFLLAALGTSTVIGGLLVSGTVRPSHLLAHRLTCGFGGLLVVAALVIPTGTAGMKEILLSALMRGGPFFALLGIGMLVLGGIGLMRFAPLPAGLTGILEATVPSVSVATWLMGLLGIFFAGMGLEKVGPLVSIGFALRTMSPVLLMWGAGLLLLKDMFVPKTEKKPTPENFEPHL